MGGDQAHFERISEENEALRHRVSELEKRVEEAARVLEITPTLLCTARPDGFFETVNAEWSRVLGFSVEEVLTLGYRGLVHPDDVAATNVEVARQLAGGRTANFINRYRCKDGSWKVLEWAATAALDGKLYASARDVTERRKTEAALRASEAKYRRLFDNINDPFVIVDMDGRFLEFNRAYQVLTGYGPEELERLTYVDLTPARWHEMEARVLRDQVLQRGYSDVYEKEYRRKDGAVVPVELRTILERDESGNPSAMWAIVRDVSERKEASERRYRALFDHMQEGLAYCKMLFVDGRPDDFVYEAVNASFERQTGLRGVVGKRMSEVVPGIRESDPRLFQLYGRVARTGVPERTELYVAASDAWFSLSVYCPEPEHFVVILSVITEAKRAQEALRQSEARLRRFIDTSMEGFGEIDLDGRVQSVNPRLEEMFGFPPGAMVGLKLVEDLLFPEDRDAFVVRQLSDRRAGRTSGAYEQRFRRGDGTELWTIVSPTTIRDPSGDPSGSFAMMTDITERRRANEALRGTKTMLEEGQRIAHVGSFEYVVSTRATVWSDEEYRIFGLEPNGPSPSYDELLAKHFHPGDVAQLDQAFRAALRNGTVFEMEHRILRPDGSVRWVRSSALPHFDHSGRLARYVGATLDVTEARQAQEALRAAARRDAEAEALREADRRKDEFLAMLGHELRNPLAPIRNSLYLLNRTPMSREQARRARAVIERQVEHLTRLVDDLLDVSRITRGKVVLQRQRLDLSQLAWRTVEDYRPSFRQAEVGLEVVTESGEVWVNGDRTRLSQVVGNLLSNAVKFTPAGGKTTVTVRADVARGEAVVVVRDTGRGLEPTLLPRLFEPFTQADVTLDRKAGGLGLGLSLVKGLVEMHGGSVGGASEGPGKGATFTVVMPLDAETQGEVGPGPARAHVPSRRVLIVEDNVDAAESFREVLTLEGHEVEVALSGPEGLEKARAFRPDVVFCDIGLPGMDGYEVARTLRAEANLGRMRLVALTGYAGPGDVARAKEAGFDAHLAKPPTLEAVEKELLGS